jgi:DNA polymerase-3 subunit epsilon
VSDESLWGERRDSLLEQPVAFVDVETTGGRAGWDRVIDIGIVAATGGVFEYEWSTLVNPGVRVPDAIRELTGISEEMLAEAPPFEAVAAELLARLRGRLFVAHNARFDYGFLRGECKLAGLKYSGDVACTVRLSRRLFPDEATHGLDALIQRHALECGRRHRALPDAQALWQFWSVLGAQFDRERIETALAEVVQCSTAPAHLPPSLPDDMPEAPGVYLFHDPAGALLYVGKASDIRQGVLDYWQLARKSARARRVVELSARVEWIETTGMMGARLAHTRLIQEHRPQFNKVSRALTRVLQESAA